MQLNSPSFEKKILSHQELLAKLTQDRLANPDIKIGFTNGCFDIIHRGHVTYIAQSKSLVDKLVIALNTDASVRRLGKAADRPINPLEYRLAVIAALEAADYVTYFDQDTPYELIEILQPEVLIKGGDWTIDKIVGSSETIARGGHVHSIPFLYDTSTSKLISKIKHDN